MNKIIYYLKYFEYLFRKCWFYLILDINFYLFCFKVIYGDIFDIKLFVILNEKICYCLVYDYNVYYMMLVDKFVVWEYVLLRM